MTILKQKYHVQHLFIKLAGFFSASFLYIEIIHQKTFKKKNIKAELRYYHSSTIVLYVLG